MMVVHGRKSSTQLCHPNISWYDLSSWMSIDPSIPRRSDYIRTRCFFAGRWRGLRHPNLGAVLSHPEVQCVLKAGALNGERPHWRAVEKRLYWVYLREPARNWLDPLLPSDHLARVTQRHAQRPLIG